MPGAGAALPEGLGWSQVSGLEAEGAGRVRAPRASASFWAGRPLLCLRAPWDSGRAGGSLGSRPASQRPTAASEASAVPPPPSSPPSDIFQGAGEVARRGGNRYCLRPASAAAQGEQRARELARRQLGSGDPSIEKGSPSPTARGLGSTHPGRAATGLGGRSSAWSPGGWEPNPSRAHRRSFSIRSEEGKEQKDPPPQHTRMSDARGIRVLAPSLFHLPHLNSAFPQRRREERKKKNSARADRSLGLC